jgi:hypothetical protein
MTNTTPQASRLVFWICVRWVALIQRLTEGRKAGNYCRRARVKVLHQFIAFSFIASAGLHHPFTGTVELLKWRTQGQHAAGKARHQRCDLVQQLDRSGEMLLRRGQRLTVLGQAGIGVKLLNLCGLVTHLLGRLKGITQTPKLITHRIEGIELGVHS